MNNCLLYDWLSFTLPEEGDWFNEYGESLADGHVIIELLGMSGVAWEVCNSRHGYSKKLWFDGINISLPSEKQHNIWLEMSGSGCRAFETYGHGDWERLFSFALKWCHLTRLDVSFDDHSGILKMSEIVDDTFFKKEYVSKALKHRLQMDVDDRRAGSACTVYHGSRQSNTLIRIYDKAEQLQRDGEHWVRVEMELHEENARRFLELEGDIGSKWCGVLLNYLRYVDPVETDSNRWRWPLKDYWAKLVQDAQPIRLFVKPGVEYNMMNVDRYVFGQAGNSIRTYIQVFGVECFLQRLKETQPFATPEKYKRLIDQYRRVGT